MKKNRTSRRIWSALLALVMVLGLIPPTAVTAVGADYVTRTADAGTINDYEKLFLDPAEAGVALSTENAGGVWTDKSVFAANAIPAELANATSELNSKIQMTDTKDNFLVALSALASNKEIVGYSTRPTDTMLVLDLSGSMRGSVSAMVTAANKAIADLLALNQYNRVGVVLFSGNTSFGDSNTSTATLLMPLNRYTTTSTTGFGSNRTALYIQANNSEQVSVANGVSPRTGLGSGKNTSGGTYTQNGIYKAMQELVDADGKVIADGAIQSGTTRLPIMVLMSDGAPTAATKNYTQVGTSDVGNGKENSDYADDMAFLTQLTMAYAKREIDTAYGTESLLYTLGYSVDGNNYAQSVLDPEAYTTNRINTLWNTFNRTAAGRTFQVNDRGTYENVTKHTDAANKYAKELADYRYYTDEYFPASRQSDLTLAFQSIVDEIILQAKYYPTYVEQDYDHDGYITFTDKIGGYMEVTDVKGVVIGDTLFSGEKLARSFEDPDLFGTVENPTELANNFIWSIMERLHIESVAEARSLLDAAYRYGQMGVHADGTWSNYIGWYSDAEGRYLDFWDASLTTAVPEGATHIIRSYGMLGQTDPAHGISAEDMMYASIRITQELDDYDQDGITGETFLTWQIPASLIPTLTYQVTVQTNSNNEITSVESVELENENVKPIRLLYEVALRKDIHEYNIAELVHAGYRDGTANKDAGYVFYTNQWNKSGDPNETSRNTYSHFEPSVQNERYYYTEDSIVYTDTNGTRYTGSAAPSANGTYYRSYTVYEKLTNGTYRSATHYEQISAQSLAKAESSEGGWVIPKGTVHRFLDPYNVAKEENRTATSPNVNHPTIVSDQASGHYYAYSVLGNNGKLTVTPATGIKLTKLFDGDTDDTFTFTVGGGTGTAQLIRLDANGELASRTDVPFENGSLEITLAANETVYLIGLTDDVTYTVTEKESDTYKVTQVTVNGQTVDGTSARLTAANQTIQAATFTNGVRGYGDLYITKHIESDHTVPAAVAGQSFQLRVDVGTALAGKELSVKLTDMDDPTKDYTTTKTVSQEGYIDVTLRNTQTAKVLGLPEGTVVTVTELLTQEQQAYFTSSIKTLDHTGGQEDSDNTVTIYKDLRATASVTNNYKPVPAQTEIRFAGTKAFDAEKMTEDATFTFRLQQFVRGQWTDVDTASVTIPAGTKDASEAFSFDTMQLTFEKEGIYSCQILEDVGDNEDITYDRSVYTFSVIVTDTGSKLEARIVANVESGDEANFGVTQNGNVWTVATVFNNEYHTTATSIDIVKSVEDKAGTGKTGLGFVVESYNATVDANGLWTLGSLIRSATTDAEGEARLARNYDNTDFANDTDGDNRVSYHFVIKERDSGLTGWTYDKTVYLVTVDLTRTVGESGTESIAAAFTIHKGVPGANGTFTAGEAVSTVSGDTATITFANTFAPDDAKVDLNIVPVVKKQLEGRALKDGEFTFRIYADGDRKNALATGTNDAQGNVVFDKPLTFSQIGSYRLDIVEEQGQLGGVSYDATVYDMVVIVTETDGVLSAQYFFEDSTTKTVTFKNTYNAAQTSIAIEGTKKLTGKDLLNGEFRFTLTQVTDATGNTPVANGVTRIAANNPDNDGDRSASFVFDRIPYTAPGQFYYAIAEEGAGTTANGVTHTNKTAVVKVTVTDQGDGTLKAVSEVVSGGDLVFTNTYVPQPTHAELSSSKILDGRVLIDGEFEFTLTEKTDDSYTTDKTGGVKETVKNNAHGHIFFSAIHFNEPGDHYYVIEEAKGSAGGVIYDDTVYHVHINVADNQKGQLIATTAVTKIATVGGQSVETEADAIIFYNNYVVDGDAALILSGTKTYTGGTLTDGKFTFELYRTSENFVIDTTPLTTASNLGNAYSIRLSYTEADAGQTFYYVLREKNKGQTVDGTTYSDQEYRLTVKVEDDGVGGIKLTVTTDKPQSTGNGVTTVTGLDFTNTYATGAASVTISGTKTLKEKELEADMFSFQLYRTDSTFSTAGVTPVAKRNSADGSFAFDKLTFDAAGTYYFLVAEQNGGQTIDRITYDDTVYKITVQVTDNGQGKLIPTVTGNGIQVSVNGSDATVTDVNFTNTYKPLPTTPDTSDTMNPVLWFVLLCLSATAMAIALIFRKKILA